MVTNNTSLLFIRSGSCYVLSDPSLFFFSHAFPMLLVLNFSTSCVLNSEWWQEGLHLNLNPSPKQLFSSVNLCGIQNRHVVSLFLCLRRSSAGITSLLTDFYQSQSVQGAHLGGRAIPWRTSH